MSDQKRRREDFYEIGYEILDTTRVQHGCRRRFDPGLRWYEANKHRTQSESPAALGPTGARLAVGAKCLAPGGRKCLCPPADLARAVLTCSASSPDSGVGLTAPHGEEAILFGRLIASVYSRAPQRTVGSKAPHQR